MSSKTFNEYNGMKVGDIITTYSQGYHRLIKIVEHEYGVSAYYTQVALTDGTIKNGKAEKQCHINYCKPALKNIEKTIDFMSNGIQKLENLKKLVQNSGK